MLKNIDNCVNFSPAYPGGGVCGDRDAGVCGHPTQADARVAVVGGGGGQLTIVMIQRVVIKLVDTLQIYLYNLAHCPAASYPVSNHCSPSSSCLVAFCIFIIKCHGLAK